MTRSTNRSTGLSFCVALALATGCTQEAPTGPSPEMRASTPVERAPSAPDSSVADSSPALPSLQVQLPPVGMVGQQLRPTLMALPYERLTEQTPVRWTIGDTSVARLDDGATHESMGYSGQPLVTILAAGVVTLTVSALGVTGGAVLRAVASDPGFSDELEIESFVLDEAHDGGLRADYVPRATLRNHSGSAVDVFGVQFMIPGLDPIPYCWTRRTVAPGRSFELFRVAYGDPDLYIAGLRATGPGTIQIYFVGGAGRAGKVVATVPVTPAPLAQERLDDPHPSGWECGPPLMTS
jgi:hypothetical protein